MIAVALLYVFSAIAVPLSELTDESYDGLWKAYTVKYSKHYSTEDEATFRRKIWEEKLAKISKHNLEAEFGLQIYKLGLNKFADKTREELDVILRCFKKKTGSTVSQIFKASFNLKYFDLPLAVDWREKGFVTPVKDQGDCGSCWAFSSTGALEGQSKAKTGRLVELSEQNLIDCSRKEGNEGCDGGWMDSAFQYIIHNEGIDAEVAYQYEGTDGPCRFKRSEVAANCTGYYRIKEGNEQELQIAVARAGPVAVAIDAFDDDFIHYKSGIYTKRTCSTVDLNHAVLVVGYGFQNESDYWIVKNSWGTDWGMDGYILMSRNAGNQCGIATHAVIPYV